MGGVWSNTSISLDTRPLELQMKALLGLVSTVSYSRPSFMTFESASQFPVYLLWGKRLFSIVS